MGGISSGRVRVEPTKVKSEGGPFFPRLTIPINLDLNPGSSGQQDRFFTTLAIERGLFIDGYASKASDATLTTNAYSIRSSISIPWSLESSLLTHFEFTGLRREGNAT